MQVFERVKPSLEFNSQQAWLTAALQPGKMRVEISFLKSFQLQSELVLSCGASLGTWSPSVFGSAGRRLCRILWEWKKLRQKH